MKLSALIAGQPILSVEGSLDFDVKTIESSETYDFAERGPLPTIDGILFVQLGPLLPGQLEQYAASNVRALVIDRELRAPPGMTLIRVVDPAEFFGIGHARLQGDPSKQMTVIGITGSNGKTSVSCILESILRSADLKTAVAGTLGYRIGDQYEAGTENSSVLTSPPAAVVQAFLAKARAQSVSHVILEASSQGLQERRLDGTAFDVAVFTTFSPEHLDFHLTEKDYFLAKARLFTAVLRSSPKKERTACIHTNEPKGKALFRQVQDLPYARLGFGRRAGALQQIYARKVQATPQGLKAEVATPRGTLQIDSKLLGSFQLTNILAAIAASEALEIAATAIVEGIRRCPQIPGRMEVIPNPLGIHIYFDWAHTLEAYRTVLRQLRSWKAGGKLYAVFGCEDVMPTAKRLGISVSCARYADGLYVALEGLDEEEQNLVREQMEEGFAKFPTPRAFFPAADDAIRTCLDRARPGDTVALLGMNLPVLKIAADWLQAYVKNRAQAR